MSVCLQDHICICKHPLPGAAIPTKRQQRVQGRISALGLASEDPSSLSPF